jgi:hypothetical protein
VSIEHTKIASIVRGEESTICVVTIICDRCGLQRVRADAYEYDTEMAVDSAIHGGGWRIDEDYDADGERAATCWSCVDDEVTP